MTESILANEKFLSMLAHELRNPLAPITNAIYVIEKHKATISPLVKISTNILIRQVNHIVGTINDLLEINKIIKKELVINKRNVEICSIVKKTLEECKTNLNSRHQVTEINTPNKAVWVLGDAEKLKQIITHLINNAVKFTETGGKISVTVNFGNEKVMVTIKDNGIGFPSEIVSDIFNISFQSDYNNHMIQGGGLGISLFLIKHLATLHDGTIEASSEGIGKGSEFSLILPLLEVSDPINGGEKVTIRPTNRCFSILIVDDHIDTAESLEILLKMWGHQTKICHNGTTAIQLAKTLRPDVALLDIGLPGCDGYQVAQEIKKRMSKYIVNSN